MAFDGPEKCPKCGKLGMPTRRPNSHAIGRRCQECGYVEEFRTEEPT
jgi:DNA-directed RNA polymerase subunit M/transcription elongation factor TFIIS